MTFRGSERAKSQTSRRRCYLTKKSSLKPHDALVFLSAVAGRKVVIGCGDIHLISRGLDFPLVTLIAKHRFIVVVRSLYLAPIPGAIQKGYCTGRHSFLSFPAEWRFTRKLPTGQKRKVNWPFARHLLESIRAMADAGNL